MKKYLLIVALLGLTLSACSDNTPAPVTQPYYQPVAAQAAPAPVTAPVIVNQAPAADNSGLVTGALVGGALGYMAGSSGSNNRGYDRQYYDRPTTTINKTVVVKQYVTAPVAKVAPAPIARPSVYTAPAVQPSVSRMGLSKPAPSPTFSKPASYSRPSPSPSFSRSSSTSSSRSFGGFSKRK